MLPSIATAAEHFTINALLGFTHLLTAFMGKTHLFFP
jgi:hypothetical protein